MEFQTSSFCKAGSCVGVAAVSDEYVTSSFCGAGGCLAVNAASSGYIAIADTKLAKDGKPDPNPMFSPYNSYSAFWRGVNAGEFDWGKLSVKRIRSSFSLTNCLWVWLTGNNMVAVWEDKQPIGCNIIKTYNREEWEAYVAGVKNGELLPEPVVVAA